MKKDIELSTRGKKSKSKSKSKSRSRSNSKSTNENKTKKSKLNKRPSISNLSSHNNNNNNNNEHHQQTIYTEDNLGVKFPVNFAINKPKLALCAFCGAQCFFLLLFIILLALGVNVVPFSTEVPLYLRNNPTYERMDMVILAKDKATYSVEDRDSQLDRQVQDVYFELMFVSNDESSVLTQERLQYMADVEQSALNLVGYNNYCHLSESKSQDTRACTRRATIINFFDPNFINSGNLSFSKYFDPLVGADPIFTVENINSVVGNWSNWNSTRMKLEYGVAFAPIWQVTDSQFGVPIGNPVSKAVRVEYSMGVPLKDLFSFKSDVDRYEDQEELIGEFLYDTYNKWGDERFEARSDMKMYYSDDRNLMSQLAIQELLVISLSLTIASMMFVYFYISCMTSSFFLGTLGMGQILFSMLPATLLYVYIFQQQYFGTFNILSIFIILGIGADDLFVFIDHFNQSKTTHVPEFIRTSAYMRMSFTYRSAGKAMLVTSLTTIFAFLANSTSSFPAVYTFGIFSALLVLVNYCSVVSYWVAVVAFFHFYFEEERICLANRCCPGYCPTKNNDIVRKFSAHNDDDDDIERSSLRKNNKESTNASSNNIVNENNELGVVERFFRDIYSPKVANHDYGRYIVFGITIVILIVFISFAVQLEPDPETPAIHKDGTNYGDFGKVKAALFGGRLDNPRKFSVFIVFGLKGIDRSGTNPTRADDRGEIIFDDNFEINTVNDQLYLWNLCQALKKMATPNNKYKVEVSVSGSENILCLFDAFQQWYDDEVENPNSNKTNSSFKFPVQANHCALGTEKGCFEEAFKKFFLDPTTRQIGLFPTTNLDKWKEYIYAENASPDPILRMLMIEVKLNQLINAPYEDGIALYETWESWMQDWLISYKDDQNNVQLTPDNLKSGFQYTLGAWHYFFLQEKLIQEAFQGISISLVLAWFVMTFATGNIIVSTLATLTILWIVVCVIGFLVMMGWKLGILESINLILVPGLAVDYTVHLADAFLASHSTNRRGRVHDMLTEVGVSIISGAFSTLGATIFMMVAPISFFFKFAMFIFATILLSSVFSLGFFTSSLAIFGPENDTGSIQPFLDKFAICWLAIKSKFSKTESKASTETSSTKNVKHVSS